MHSTSAAILLLSVAAILGYAVPVEAKPDRLNSVIPAGDRVIVSDSKGTLWIRNANGDSSSNWKMLSVPSKTATIRRVLCSLDGSGDCAFLLDDKTSTKIGFIRANSTEVTATDQSASNIIGILASDKLSFTLAEATGKRSVSNFSLSTGNVTAVGAIEASETGLLTNVNGETQILAISAGGGARLLSNNRRFSIGNIDFPIHTRFGSLYSEKLYSSNPFKQGATSFGVGHWIAEDTKLRPKFVNISTAHSVEFTAIPESFTGSGNGDIFAVYAGKAGKRIGYLCSESSGAKATINFGVLGTIASDESATLIATGSASSVYATLTSPRYGQKLMRFDLVSKKLQSIGDRKCSGETVSVSELFNSEQALPVGWTVKQQTIKTKQGVMLNASVLAPSDGPVKNVIVDVYGAYGTLRTFIRPADSILAKLKTSQTALIVATVRGDGDSGYQFAMTPRAPSRQLAVDDVITIAQHARDKFLNTNGKVTVRGHSGGGWLAFNAALQRPDLFTGAIGYSGAYMFADDKKIASGEFFAPGDSLERLFPTERLAKQCNGQHYIFIHTKDDPVASYAQASSFHKTMVAAGCKADMVSMERGGHNLIDMSVSDVLEWAGSSVSAYYTPL